MAAKKTEPRERREAWIVQYYEPELMTLERAPTFDSFLSPAWHIVGESWGHRHIVYFKSTGWASAFESEKEAWDACVERARLRADETKRAATTANTNLMEMRAKRARAIPEYRKCADCGREIEGLLLGESYCAACALGY